MTRRTVKNRGDAFASPHSLKAAPRQLHATWTVQPQYPSCHFLQDGTRQLESRMHPNTATVYNFAYIK